MNNNEPSKAKPISKSKRKKIERLAQIQEKRKVKRKQEKQKRKEKGLPSRNRIKDLVLMKDSSCKQRIVIDLQFQQKMTDKELMQLSRQLMFCYASNRRLQSPSQLYFTSAVDTVRSRMDKMGCPSWDVNIKSENVLDVFDSNELIYLTSESNEELMSLDEDKVYIIGGLVDHNSLKIQTLLCHKWSLCVLSHYPFREWFETKTEGFCLNYAIEKGIKHARLPIDRFINMKTRRVLAINHVLDILLAFIKTKDWTEALSKNIPTRTNAVIRSNPEETIENNCDNL